MDNGDDILSVADFVIADYQQIKHIHGVHGSEREHLQSLKTFSGVLNRSIPFLSATYRHLKKR